MLNLLRSLVTASAVVFLTLSTAAQAFVLLPTPPASGFVMNFNLLPTSQFNTIGYGSQSWNSLAQSAVDAWNQVGIGPGMDHNFFLVRVPTVVGDPCTRDGVNEVRRAADFCGMSFGSALAIAQSWSINGVRVEVDIVFNNTKSWDAYPGALRSAGGGGTLNDFYRVALHEFGHAAGLDHPDELGQAVPAIMNSTTSNIDRLQTDDINGAHAIQWGSAGPPTIPGSLSASAVSSSQINSSWTASMGNSGSGLAGYKIERCTGSGCTSFAQIATITATSYSDTGRAASTPYTYRVRAFDNAGINSGYSNTASATTARTNTRAVVTSPAAGSTLSSSTVTFTWNAGSGASQYWLYVGTTGAGSVDIYNVFQGTGLSRSVSGLPTNGSTVYVRLFSFISGAWQFNDYTYTASLNTSGPFNGLQTGPLTAATVKVSANIATLNLGQTGEVYIAAQLPNGQLFFFNSSNQFVLYTGGVAPAFKTGALANTGDVAIVPTAINLTAVAGTQVFVGYGLGSGTTALTEMVSVSRFAQVLIVQ